MTPIFIAAVLSALGYLSGSIPWGIIWTRLFTPIDIRREGSRNIGATNVRRVAGTPLGLMTLAGDVLKGTIPVLLAVRLIGTADPPSQWSVGLVALCAFLGHLFPLYLKGREGGKGVATAAGCFLALSPAAVGVALLIFILFACMTSRVSAASLAAAASLPLVIWEALGSGPLTICAGTAAALIFIRHRENIRRLMAGSEPRF